MDHIIIIEANFICSCLINYCITGLSVTVCTVLHAVHTWEKGYDSAWSLAESEQYSTKHKNIYTQKVPFSVKAAFENCLLEICFLDCFSELKWAIKFQEENM